MKILHWDEMFHPSFGYQINVLAKFQSMQCHEVVVITSDNIENHPTFAAFGDNDNIKEKDEMYSRLYGVTIIRLPIHRVVSGRVVYKSGYLEKIKELQPDVIMCHTNDTLSAIRIAQNYKYINIPIVFDNHMLEMASKNPFNKLFRLYFKHFITPLIIKNNWTVIKTQDSDYVNKCLGIPEKQTPFISFGSDTRMFYPNVNTRSNFRVEHNIGENDFVVIYTGKLDKDKGGLFLAETFKKKFDTCKNIVLVLVGNVGGGEYGVKVDESFKQSENRIIRFCTQKYVELAKFYQSADLSVFARQCSLSFYDAQACGLPVVSENNNINIDRLKHNNGFTFEAESVDDFRKKVIECADMSVDDYKKIGENALNFIKNNYDYENIAKQYTDILEKEFLTFQHQKSDMTC